MNRLFRIAQWILVVLLHSHLSWAQQAYDGQWGPWTAWSVCDKTCGAGLAYRIRRCHNRPLSSDVTTDCPGADKQYQVCNKQECPERGEDYRTVECRKHNSNYYGGRRYEWEAFINPYARCELACKARHHRYYARFQAAVEDGIRCKHDEDAFCMGGECLDAGCDGILGSGAIVDQCGVCGGDGSTCRVISGIFTRIRLAHSGYHHVTTIPIGACNINITELAGSRNYLALSTTGGSILNGDMHLRPIGKYSGAGTEFDYRRRSGHYCPGTCIFADGPLTQTVEVQLLYYDRNPGIMYHYTVPQNTADQVMSSANSTHLHHHEQQLQQQRQQHEHNSGDSVPKQDSSLDDSGHKDNRHRKHHRHKHHPKHEEEFEQVAALTDSNSDVTTASLGDEPFHSKGYQFRGEYHERDSRPEGTFPNRHEGAFPSRNSQQESRGRGDRHEGRRQSYSSDLHSKPFSASTYHPENPAQPSPSVIPRQASIASGPLFVPPEGQEGAPLEYRHYYHTDSEDYRRLTAQRQGFAALDSQTNVVGGAAGAEALRRPNIIPATRDAQARWREGNRPWSGTGSRYDVDNRVNSVGDVPLSVPASGSFVWTISGFTPCSEPCGGGSQQTQVVCMKSDTRVVVIAENCNINARPSQTTVECNTQPCSSRWTAGTWSDCSVTCGNGLETRTVECKQRISPTLHLSVSADRCTDQKPPTTQFCRRPACFQWQATNWTQCSTNCGLGERTRNIQCVNGEGEAVSPSLCAEDRPKTREICDMGSCAKGWYYTKWTRDCSPECGKSHKTRQVYCAAEDGSTLPGDKCPLDQKPRERKSCGAAKPCGGKWFAGPWSECNTTCGEGAWRTREVVCMKKHGRHLWSVVGKENCVRKERPSSKEECTQLAPCQPEWYTTHWTECSASCGTGTKTREVKCLDADRQSNAGCPAQRRPHERRPCNPHSCDVSDNRYDSEDDGYQESTSPNVTVTRFHRNRTRPPAPLHASLPAKIDPQKIQRSAMGDEERHQQAHNDSHHTHHVSHRPKQTHRHHHRDNDNDDDDSGDAQSKPVEQEDRNCTDEPNERWCMFVSQARLCRYGLYRHQCCKACKKYHH